MAKATSFLGMALQKFIANAHPDTLSWIEANLLDDMIKIDKDYKLQEQYAEESLFASTVKSLAMKHDWPYSKIEARAHEILDEQAKHQDT